MNEITTGEMRNRLSDAINRAAFGGERVVVTRHGKGVVAIVPIDDLERLEAMDERLDEIAIDNALAEQGKEPPIDWEVAKGILQTDRRTRSPKGKGGSRGA